MLENFALFFLEEVLDLLVECTYLGDVLLMQLTHLLEHLSRQFGALFILIDLLELKHVLQFIYSSLLVRDLTLELKQRVVVLVLSLIILTSEV